MIVYYKFQIDLTSNIADSDLQKLESADYLDTKTKAERFLYANGSGFGLIESAFNIIGKIFIFLGIISVISTLNFYMVILFVILVLITSYFESKIKNKVANIDLEIAPVERKSFYLVTLLEDFKVGKEIRLYNLKNFLLNKMVKHFDTAQHFYRKQQKMINSSKYFSSFISLIRDSITYIYLIFKVIEKAISIGDFTMYTSAISQFSSAMTNVMQDVLNINQFKVYFEAFEKFSNIEKSLRDGKKLPIPQSPYTIKFVNVSFKYPGQDKYALRNVNITIRESEKLSIIGENGAGKTTFVKLLMRLYDPTEGEIYLNNTSIKDLDYDKYQSILSAVFQDFQLFSFTLKENVAFDAKVDDSIIEAILKDIGLKNKLNKLEKGVNTNLYKNFETDGFEPSGGEGQKIAIARAIFKDAAIIILDEPTAALDPKAEDEIYQNFDKLVQGKTAIYISHRLASTKFCDKIAVFKDGEIIEYGAFDELIHQNSTFKELYRIQSQYYVNLE